MTREGGAPKAVAAFLGPLGEMGKDALAGTKWCQWRACEEDSAPACGLGSEGYLTYPLS